MLSVVIVNIQLTIAGHLQSFINLVDLLSANHIAPHLSFMVIICGWACAMHKLGSCFVCAPGLGPKFPSNHRRREAAPNEWTSPAEVHLRYPIYMRRERRTMKSIKRKLIKAIGRKLTYRLSQRTLHPAIIKRTRRN